MLFLKTLLLSSLLAINHLPMTSNASVKQATPTPLIGAIDIKHSQYCYGPIANDDWWSQKYTVLANWHDYGTTWNNFLQNYHYFTFSRNSSITIISPYATTFTNSLAISTEQILDHPNFTFVKSQHYSAGWFSSQLMLDVGFAMWHDEKNIYWDAFLGEFSLFYLNTSEIDCNFESFVFD